MNEHFDQNKLKAKTFKVAAWTLLTIALILSIILTPFVGAIPLFASYLFFRQSKKYSAISGDSIIKVDSRPIVLYLRSFNDEIDDQSIIKYFKSIAVPAARDLAKTTPSAGFREQDALGFVFRKVGPYIALAKPGEQLPELGSSKIHVPNESWQDTVLDFIKRSRLIIFRAGKTEGLKWELNEMIKRVNPKKIVIILPVKNEDYFSFIAWANLILPVAFTNEYPICRMAIFDEDWNPSYLPQGRTLTSSFKPFFQQNAITVKETYWEKILEHNGIRW